MEKDDEDGIESHVQCQNSLDETVSFWTSYRLRLSILCSAGFLLALTHRADLSLAMVCMVNGTSNNTYKESGEVFNWDKELRSVILSSFLWGHAVFQIPTLWIVRKFEATKIITVGTLCVALLTVVTPWCARVHAYLLIVDRVLVGAGQATLVPATQKFFLYWAPPGERSRLLGIVFSGFNLGAALTFPLSGLLCTYGFDGGWPSIFYLLGIAGFLWSCAWHIFAVETPDRSRFTNKREKLYIENSLQTLHANGTEAMKTPWKSIFCSRPVWVCLIAECVMASGLGMMLAHLPAYMDEVMNFNEVENGLLLTLPFISSYVFLNIGGCVSDKLTTNKILPNLWIRRIVAGTGFFGAAALLVVLSQLDSSHRITAMLILNIIFGFCGLQIITTVVNFPEICGKHVGVVMVIASMFASLSGVAATYIAGVVTKNATEEEWMMAWIITASTYVLGGLFFCVFARTDIQEWAIDKATMCCNLEIREKASDTLLE